MLAAVLPLSSRSCYRLLEALSRSCPHASSTLASAGSGGSNSSSCSSASSNISLGSSSAHGFKCGMHSSSSAGSHNVDYFNQPRHSTTILCVRKDDQVIMIGDGQVSIGNMIAKPNARKVRRIGENVVAGFAGSAADGLSLLERLETKLEEHPGQLMRAAVELAKLWRQDKALRFLQAELLVADPTTILTVSGNGDVLEPTAGVMAIGSGGGFATAAARALQDIPGMDALTIGKKSMQIACDMCVFTNDKFVWEVLVAKPVQDGSPAAADNTSAVLSQPPTPESTPSSP